MWINEYEELILSGKFEQARLLRKLHLPKRLYKYRTLNKELLDNARNDTIWLCSPARMNDPYESSIHVEFQDFANYLMSLEEYWEQRKGIRNIDPLCDADLLQIRQCDKPYEEYFNILETKYLFPPEYRIRLGEDLKQSIGAMLEGQIEFLKSSVRFCSMSERYDSLLMWSHYSDQHKGVCIEYDVKSSDFLSDLCFPVIYTDKVFDATSYHTDVSKTAGMSLIAASYKHKDWGYEREWRIMVPNYFFACDANLPAIKPSAILLGTESHALSPEKPKIYHELTDIVLEKDIPFRFMQLERTDFKVVPVN